MGSFSLLLILLEFQSSNFFFPVVMQNDRLHGNTIDGQIGWHDFGKYPWLTFKKGPFENEIASSLDISFVTRILFWRRFFFQLYFFHTNFFKWKFFKERMNELCQQPCKMQKIERNCRNFYALSAFFPWKYFVNALEASPILHILWLLSCIFMMFL